MPNEFDYDQTTNPVVAASDDSSVDLDFLGSTAKDSGYDATKEPGQHRGLPPEGAYRFRFEWPAPPAGQQETFNSLGLSSKWKASTTKGKTPTQFVGTGVRAVLLGISTNPPSPITIEEFDSLNLAGRTFSSYVSTIFMSGRSSVTDLLNCIHYEKFDDSRPMREAVLALQEKLRNETCEGIATVRWVPFAITQDDQGKNKYERLNTLDPSFGKKYNRGASAFPKVEGAPATEWVEVFEGQEISVQVLPEISNFLPFKAEE